MVQLAKGVSVVSLRTGKEILPRREGGRRMMMMMMIRTIFFEERDQLIICYEDAIVTNRDLILAHISSRVLTTPSLNCLRGGAAEKERRGLELCSKGEGGAGESHREDITYRASPPYEQHPSPAVY
jgi:hypothetical protein